ncbi:putative F-box protein [Hibiscus syriacus]|uniref:F-box protein n=1 Tax=Hibiscus syriacus TaxID=106335 RepID=A0A6A3CT76_HIBSY|nr:putative F-box protein [Hibiscus syriacus]
METASMGLVDCEVERREAFEDIMQDASILNSVGPNLQLINANGRLQVFNGVVVEDPASISRMVEMAHYQQTNLVFLISLDKFCPSKVIKGSNVIVKRSVSTSFDLKRKKKIMRRRKSRYEQDLWTYIARFLDGRSLVMLGATNKWFSSVIMQECIWKLTCLRELQVPDPGHVAFSWSKLYGSVVDGSHSFIFRQQEKHIDWMRIGAFSFDSEVAFLCERMVNPPVKIPKQGNIDDMLQSSGSCMLRNIKTGIWIAGTVQIL